MHVNTAIVMCTAIEIHQQKVASAAHLQRSDGFMLIEVGCRYANALLFQLHQEVADQAPDMLFLVPSYMRAQRGRGLLDLM